MSWSITYRDGSANAYHFTADGDGASFEYDPVQPKESSTGMYSGGDPRAGKLAPDVVATLLERVRTLESSDSLRVADRNKGTGAFAIVDAAGSRSFIIARGPELEAFDALLATFGK